ARGARPGHRGRGRSGLHAAGPAGRHPVPAGAHHADAGHLHGLALCRDGGCRGAGARSRRGGGAPTLQHHAGPSTRMKLSLVRNAFSNLLGAVIPALVALATVPLVVKGLGDASYGVYSLVTAIVGYFAVLDINVTAGSVKYI